MGAILDIEHVRTFHAVARIGKFSAAAEHLHKSPAAVSVHVQRLEAVAGGRLLHRDNQSVSLTPLGRRFLTSTRALLSTHDQVLADLQGKRLAGRITLGVPDEYAAHLIRDVLPAFAAAWPNIVLELKTAPSYALRDQVQRGRLQVAIIAQPRGQLGGHQQLIVGAAHLSGDLPDPLPLAVHAAQCPYRQVMIESLKRSGQRVRIVLDSPSNQAVKACVEAGLAISLIDHARVTDAMRILEGLPKVDDHDVIVVRSAATKGDDAVDLLSRAIGQNFRL
jgi:DNA-binding transcriptional LysR family regulator